MKRHGYKIFSVVILVVVLVLMTLIAIPLIKNYNDPEKFAQTIKDMGATGFISMFFIQIAQIVVAIIPGEVVEFAAGALYGWLGGLFFCLAGILVGQTLIFMSVRYFGKNLVEKVAGSEKIKKFKFLNDERKRNTVLFFLFFVPGTPKDLLTYIVPLTNIKMKDFLVITLFARIPSIVSSTYAGDAFAEKNFLMLTIVYSCIAAVSMGGVFLYRLWEKKREKNEE